MFSAKECENLFVIAFSYPKMTHVYLPFFPPFPHVFFSFCLPALVIFLQLHKPVILEVGHASDWKVFKFYKINVVFQGQSLWGLKLMQFGELLQVKDYQILNMVSDTKVLKSKPL